MHGLRDWTAAAARSRRPSPRPRPRSPRSRPNGYHSGRSRTSTILAGRDELRRLHDRRRRCDQSGIEGCCWARCRRCRRCCCITRSCRSKPAPTSCSRSTTRGTASSKASRTSSSSRARSRMSALPSTGGYFSAMGVEAIDGDEHGQPVPTATWLSRLAPGAAATIAIGTCATWGGIPSAEGQSHRCDERHGLPGANAGARLDSP